MNLFSSPKTENLRFMVGPSSKINEVVANNAILPLRRQSIAIDYPGRSAEELESFVASSSETLRKPNRGIGGRLFSENQVFTGAISISACMNGGLTVAHLTVAHNTSSRLPGVAGMVARQAKMRLGEREWKGEPAIRHKYYWLGYCALSPRARDLLAATPEHEVNLLDIMIALGSINRHAEQTVSSYPFQQEEPWKRQLARLGLTRNPADDKPKYIFGDDSDPVIREHWTGPNVHEIRKRILAKDKATQIIKHEVEMNGLGAGWEALDRSEQIPHTSS